MRLALLLPAMLCVATARADLGSTLDEWADRYVPEAGDAPKMPVYADGFDIANANVAAGRYRAALCDLVNVPAADVRGLLLRARALIGLGETDDAFALLGTPALSADRDALALHVATLLEQARWVEALPLVEKLLAIEPRSFAGHRLYGEVLESSGRFPEAIAAYHWFLDPDQDLLRKWQTDVETFEDPAALTDFATALHRWATLTSAYKESPQLNDTVLAMYTRAYDVLDRGYDPARVAAARFCLSRGDNGKAAAALAPMIKRTPAARELLRVSAELAAASGNPAAMHGLIDTLRAADPESPDAALLEIAMAARTRSTAAVRQIAALSERFPGRLDLIGAHAALAYLSGDEPKLAVLLKQADTTVSQRSDAYVSAADILSDGFQREAAVTLLKTAIARTPWETAPRHLLGDLYLNDGHDVEARTALDAASALDPYNVKTINYLSLLDSLDGFDKLRTEHFILYSDKDADPISAEQIGAYLESVYADVCGVFDYTPSTKIVVQIYPDDDSFSVRMAGVPGVENFGVSFGRVLAAVAPRKGTKQGNFNWARVLRHEFVHTINLLQTGQRCPRWLTEGLAVWQEHVPFRFQDVPAELYRRTMASELFTIRQFPLAFTRPKRPSDGEQAYTQGAYLAMYLEKTYGRESIVKLLHAYGASKSDDQAFHAATGRSIADIETEWHAWMKVTLQPWGYDRSTSEKVAALAAEGEGFIKARQLPEALKAWQAASDLQPMSLQPHQRLAGLYLQKSLSDPAKAIEHLKFLHVIELQDNRYAKQIARLYQRLGDGVNAQKWAREATFVDLYDAAAHDLLADSAERSGDTETAEAERRAATAVRLWQEKRAAPANQTPGAD